MLILCSSSLPSWAALDDAQLLWYRDCASGNLTLEITDDDGGDGDGDGDGDHVPATDRPYPEVKEEEEEERRRD